MKALANEIYTNLLDMDFMDYSDTLEEDMECLINDLELLNAKGNGSLLNVIKILVENFYE